MCLVFWREDKCMKINSLNFRQFMNSRLTLSFMENVLTFLCLYLCRVDSFSEIDIASFEYEQSEQSEQSFNMDTGLMSPNRIAGGMSPCPREKTPQMDMAER